MSFGEPGSQDRQGFGPPPQQDTGGFGAPVPPPPGIPPAGPQQYGGPAPYGNGGPAPYGNQQQPYGSPQQPYGSQQQPYGNQHPFPQHPQGWGGPPRPSGSKAGLVVGIVAGVVVLALIGVAGLWAVNHGFVGSSSSDSQDSASSGVPAGKAMAKAWSVPIEKTAEYQDTASSLPRMWWSEKALVYGDENGVRAYDVATGKERWKLEAPERAGEVCGMSPAASSDGIGGVLFDSGGDDCSFVAAVEVDSGTVMWSKNMAGEYDNLSPHIEVNDDILTTNAGEYVTTWKAKTGGKAVEIFGRGQYCTGGTTFGAHYVVGTDECTDVKPERMLRVWEPRYGDVYEFPGEKLESGTVLGERPLTFLMDDGGDEQYIQTFTEDNRLGKRIALTGELGKLQFQAHTTFVTEEGVLLTEYENDSKMAAVDLRAGKMLWKTGDGVGQMRPLGHDGEQFLAVTTRPGDSADPTQGLGVVAIDPTTGKQTLEGVMDPPGEAWFVGTSGLVIDFDTEHVYVAGTDSGRKPTLWAFERGSGG